MVLQKVVQNFFCTHSGFAVPQKLKKKLHFFSTTDPLQVRSGQVRSGILLGQSLGP